MLILGILITGGFGLNETSIELLNANGTKICDLPSLPKGKVWQTQEVIPCKLEESVFQKILILYKPDIV